MEIHLKIENIINMLDNMGKDNSTLLDNINDVDPYTKRKNIREYEKSLSKYILTTRFNDETYESNKQFRMKSNGKINCVYGNAKAISEKIPIDTFIYVLEMNNSQNKIMGIGRIKVVSREKAAENGRKYFIYPKDTYNEYNYYIYFGAKRIDVEEMNEEQKKIISIFEKICFKGKKHLKRGKGLTSIPIHILYECSKILDLVEYIANMFVNK